MVSEGNHERTHEQAAKPQGEEERRACNDLKFSFLLRPYIIHTVKHYWLNQRWLMTFLDDPPQCLHSFRNTMLTEIGNIMKGPLSLSSSVISEWFLRTVWKNCVILINRQIRRLRKGCLENITILNLTTFVVFPHNEVTDKQLTHFLLTVFTLCGFLRFQEWTLKFERLFFSRPLHLHLLSCAALSNFLWLPLMESLLAG